jgi:hypothetical protein
LKRPEEIQNALREGKLRNQSAIAFLPLTHLTGLARAFTNGRIDAGLLPGIGYLAAFAAAAFPPALYKMRNRLIK